MCEAGELLHPRLRERQANEEKRGRKSAERALTGRSVNLTAQVEESYLIAPFSMLLSAAVALVAIEG